MDLSSSMSNVDDAADVEDIDEYSNARKLVHRAAKRESLLTDSKSSGEDGIFDFSSSLKLKKDHVRRPCWVCPDGILYLEAFHELYTSAYDFLVAIAEPVARPEYIHTYKLTPYSLYAAVATNIETTAILKTLDKLSKNNIPTSVLKFVQDCTQRYGKAKLVLKQNKFYVESDYAHVLRELLRDPLISQARLTESTTTGAELKDGFIVSTKAEEMKENIQMLDNEEDSDDDEDEDGENKEKKVTVAFGIRGEMVEVVKKQAIELDYPLMEEYDFRNDVWNADVPMDLKPHTRIRRYQERSLAKMFGNGRARSGIIVLPCGAGKTLTGVTAAQTIQKSVVCLCTNAVSVLQWKYQFQLWTNIPSNRIACFTSDRKEPLHKDGCVLITTYTMISYSGKRSETSKAVMDAISSRDWGMMLMDEVHVVPAKMFRRVVGSVKAHCRLGLTATLVREDDLISDLNFLIGPKLYEANWMDLTTQGYLANVQCMELWCPMTAPFMKEYLSPTANGKLKQLLYVMNPSKLRTVQYLINFHEARGDKIILFSDLVYSLKLYADMLKKPLIYGETPEKERQAILGIFRSTATVSTICISKVGDTSIDLPEANVIIQVSSHFGSRRQEAQRLGRILRPKSYTKQDGTNRSSAYNAFFYTLVSTDTQEMFYSAKRQQYLIDQGYTFTIVTHLYETAAQAAAAQGWEFATPQQDLQLLRKLLTSDTEMEKEQKAEDSAIRKHNADGAALADASTKRTAGLTTKQAPPQYYRDKLSSSSSNKRHPLFAKRQKR